MKFFIKSLYGIFFLWFIQLQSFNSQLETNSAIHIIGDSHSAFCFTNSPDRSPWSFHPKPNTPEYLTYERFLFAHTIKQNVTLNIPFAIHWVQGRTMHRIGRDGVEGFNIETYGVQNNDIVVFIFGSIDVGDHIYKSFILKQMASRNLDEIIDTLVTNYMSTILNNQKQYRNLPIVIFAVLPPFIHPDREKDFFTLFPNQPFFQNQVNVTKKINKKLEEHSKKNNFFFLNVNHCYETDQGILRKDLSDGWHHIHPKYNELIKKNLITLLFESVFTNQNNEFNNIKPTTHNQVP